MRKIFAFMFLALYVVAAFAQVDTLQWGQREPTYYYWDDHYADCVGATATMIMNWRGGHIIARRCYIDSELTVIGVAAPASIQIPRQMDSLATRLPEYFQLYEATDSSFDLVAEARWDTNHPRYRMVLIEYWGTNTFYEDPDSVPLVYEAYFGKPEVVRDSFYVAATMYNNCDYDFNETTMQYEVVYRNHTLYYAIYTNSIVDSMLDQFKSRCLNPYDRTDSLSPYLRRMQKLYNRGWAYIERGEECGFMPLFPIFDTTGLDIHGYRWIGQCDTVRRLRLLRFEGNDKAYISWGADTMARWWEISYGFEGTAPESGMRDSSLTSMVCLDNLEPGGHYVVYVRGRCKDDTRGPWASFITFVMPDSTSDVAGPRPSVVDRHTYLMPNPTKGPVTVFSSFRIYAIEVYSIAGTLLETIKVNANTGIVNTASWPQGAYILRVRTTHGDTAKRLIKSAY